MSFLQFFLGIIIFGAVVGYWSRYWPWLNPFDRHKGFIWGKEKQISPPTVMYPAPRGTRLDEADRRLQEVRRLLGELFTHTCQIDREGELPLELIKRIRAKHISSTQDEEYIIVEHYRNPVGLRSGGKVELVKEDAEYEQGH